MSSNHLFSEAMLNFGGLVFFSVNDARDAYYKELESDEEGVAWDSDSHKESHKDPKRSRKFDRVSTENPRVYTLCFMILGMHFPRKMMDKNNSNSWVDRGWDLQG